MDKAQQSRSSPKKKNSPFKFEWQGIISVLSHPVCGRGVTCSLIRLTLTTGLAGGSRKVRKLKVS
jgi:hypothetical protein